MTDCGGLHLSYLLQALCEVQTFRLAFHPYLSELCDIPHLPLASLLDQVLPILPRTVAFHTSLVPRALVGKMVLSLPSVLLHNSISFSTPNPHYQPVFFQFTFNSSLPSLLQFDYVTFQVQPRPLSQSVNLFTLVNGDRGPLL